MVSPSRTLVAWTNRISADEAKGSRATIKMNRLGGVLSKSRISNYEHGLRRLGIEEARLLAETLSTVSATYLLCLEDEEPNQQEKELLRCFQESDDRGRETIFALAKSQCDAANS